MAVVIAQDGDTLCGIAMDAGLLNCQRLRDDPANARFLTRRLVAGDRVTVPEIETSDEQRPSDASHDFVIKTVPPVDLRFVHGSPDKKFRDDDALDFLTISKYNTIAAGLRPNFVALPDGFGFNPSGHADPDAFKIEVVDPQAGGAANVTLEALKPLYGSAKDGKLFVKDLISFSDEDPDVTLRKGSFPCNRASSNGVFRSRYMRLVVTEADRNAVDDQTLLVSDIANGFGFMQPEDDDTVEILEQQVRASYKLSGCPASDPNKCTLIRQVPVNDPGERLRFRLAVHVFRVSPGSAQTVAGIDDTAVRHRIFKWVRRIYAQANMAPRLVDPFVEFIDPPGENMVVISQGTGRKASGVSSSSGSFSQLSLLVFAKSLPFGSRIFNVKLTKGMTPVEVGNAVVETIGPQLKVDVFTNTLTLDGARPSCDVLIRDLDGTDVQVQATTDDTGLTGQIVVPRVDLNKVKGDPSENSVTFATPDFRRILRCGERSDDRVDVFVIGDFVSTTLIGQAIMRATDIGEKFQPPEPLRSAVIIVGAPGNDKDSMDSSDDNPNAFPHELGHVLLDTIHAPQDRRELMSDKGSPTTDSVALSRRISDEPNPVPYEIWDAAAKRTLQKSIFAVQRLRERAAPVSEPF